MAKKIQEKLFSVLMYAVLLVVTLLWALGTFSIGFLGSFNAILGWIFFVIASILTLAKLFKFKF